MMCARGQVAHRRGGLAGRGWGVNRWEFRELATLRLAEAKALLDAGLPDGAYYLAGYAVECGLKACIAPDAAA